MTRPSEVDRSPLSTGCRVERRLELLFGEGDGLLGGLVLEGHRHEGRHEDVEHPTTDRQARLRLLDIHRTLTQATVVTEPDLPVIEVDEEHQPLELPVHPHHELGHCRPPVHRNPERQARLHRQSAVVAFQLEPEPDLQAFERDRSDQASLLDDQVEIHAVTGQMGVERMQQRRECVEPVGR